MGTVISMGMRAWLAVVALAGAALLLPVADGNPAVLAAMTAVLLLAVALTLASAPTPVRVSTSRTAPGRRLHGRFLQQSRPGVPGRIRARAPGSGR